MDVCQHFHSTWIQYTLLYTLDKKAYFRVNNIRNISAIVVAIHGVDVALFYY